jgi:hypothetical protein
MAVREFDGTDDTVVHSTGGLSAMTFGTTAAIFKTDANSAGYTLLALHDSGGSFLGAGLKLEGAEIGMYSAGNATFSVPIATGVWYLAVARKATGTATPRLSVYRFSNGVWVHGNAGTSIGNWTSPGASGTIRMHVTTGFDFFDGRMAVRAAWANEVHWTADASGDTAIEAAGLEDSLQNWVNESPDALWPYNQDPLSAVDDIVGGADQSSVTGTTVVSGDDPPGFSFTLGGVPNLFVTRSNLQLR